jgi:hypothetical protein
VRVIAGVLGVLLLLAGCSARPEDPGYTVLLETEPAPMQSGRLNTVTVRVADRADRPVSGARVTVQAQHSGMAHGRATISTGEAAPGVYRGDLLPTMGGTYSLTVTVEGAQSKVERAINFNVR